MLFVIRGRFQVGKCQAQKNAEQSVQYRGVFPVQNLESLHLYKHGLNGSISGSFHWLKSPKIGIFQQLDLQSFLSIFSTT